MKHVKKLERLHAKSENRNGAVKNAKKSAMVRLGETQLSVANYRKEPFVSNKANTFDSHRITSSLSKITKKHEGKSSHRQRILEQ